MPLVLDGTTGFNLPVGAEIGVGTTAPAGNGLHVDHTAGATLRLTRLGTSTSHFVQLETDGAHGTLRSEGNFTLQSGGANPRITVLSTGFVGIGNQATNPTRPLHVNHNGASGGVIATFQSNGNPWIQQAGGVSSFQFGSTSNGWELFNDNNSAYLLAVKTDGKVGIGTRTPADKLEIQGSGSDGIRFSVTGQSYYHKIRSNGDGLLLSADDSDAGGAGADIRFRVANDEKMRINHDGNVGIGTTDPSYAKLHVLNDSSAGNDNFMLMLQNTTTAADTRSGIMFSTNSGQGAGRDGSAIQASNNGVDGKAHITFGNVFNNTYDEKIRFTTDGRIGIGEDLPDTLLHISGAPDNKVITIDQNGRASAIGTYFSSDAIGSRIDFYISNGNTNGDSNNRMSILGSGNVGIGTIGPVSSGYDTGSKKLTVMSTTLNNATSGYLELASRANTAGYNAGAIQFNNFENAGTAGSGTQNRTVGQIRTVITTTDSNAGDDSGGTMEFYTKPEAQALAKTMTISTQDPNHRADVTVDATQLAGDSGVNANAFFNAKAKGNYYAGLDIKSNSGHVGGWIGHWNGSSTSRALQARVGGNGINASDYNAIYIDYLGRVTHPLRPHFRSRGFSGHYYVSSIQSAEANRLRGWKHVDVNRGSHFDNSTGKFTIPVTGDYAFYCTVMFTNPSTMDFHLSFQLNGATLTANNDHNGGGSGQGHQWNGSNLSYSGYFSANDYVGFSITGGGSTSNTYLYGASVYSVMGGYLL